MTFHHPTREEAGTGEPSSRCPAGPHGRSSRWDDASAGSPSCFGLVVAQLVNIQVHQAQALNASPKNPRIAPTRYHNLRGDILASDGEVLATSVRAPKGSLYEYQREYPAGSLFS